MRIPIGTRKPYEVLVGNGLIDGLAPLLRECVGAYRYAVITDSTVARSHALRVSDAIAESGEGTLLSFPAGEPAKTRETWSDLTDQLLAAGMSRDCAVVAVGGGVVGDVAGFVAATFMRGVPLIHVPTTLLAMVDSSIGGKTGVDTHHGKNLVGAFHQPALVVADLDTLRTLPREEINNGLAEALKHGAVADANYFEQVESASGESAELGPIVEGSVRIKGLVVAEDEHERGKRSVLNFGHTVAHAVERATDFGIGHGAAVSIGMVAEARIGTALGLSEGGTAERLGHAGRRLGLPTELPARVAPETVIGLMGFDKKNRRGSIRCSLLKHIGAALSSSEGGWTHEVPESVARSCLNHD